MEHDIDIPLFRRSPSKIDTSIESGSVAASSVPYFCQKKSVKIICYSYLIALNKCLPDDTLQCTWHNTEHYTPEKIIFVFAME